MVDKYLPPDLITPDEAVALFEYATISEMSRVKALYEAYRKRERMSGDVLWDAMRLLSFIYNTARIQGIREERARKK